MSHPLAIRLNLVFVQFESTPYATYLVIMLAFFVGLLAASLLGVLERFRLRRTLKAKNRELAGLAKELANLRNLPLTDETLAAKSEPLPAADGEKEA